MKQLSFFATIALTLLLTAGYIFAGGQEKPFSDIPVVPVSGKVVETMSSGGYTYLLIEKNGAKTWAAIPSTKVQKGQTVTLRPGAEMENFFSSTLNRKFDKIIFSAGLAVPQERPASEGAAGGALTGTVSETMNSGGYTYMLLEKNGTKTWVAAPQMKVVKGQKVSLAPGPEMSNFSSATLKRTFDKIIFSTGPAGQTPKTAMTTGGSKDKTINPPEKIKVEKATGPNAYTVAEIYQNIGHLDKKEVALRGKIVKVSQGIMGKNWLHLQDGSGEREKSTNDLVVTTQEEPSAGDVVTVNGIIYRDKDFGSGYRYRVIMEDAHVKK
jgi:hypothetical protein